MLSIVSLKVTEPINSVKWGLTVFEKPLLKADTRAQEAGGREVGEEACHADQAKKEDPKRLLDRRMFGPGK